MDRIIHDTLARPLHFLWSSTPSKFWKVKSERPLSTSPCEELAGQRSMVTTSKAKKKKPEKANNSWKSKRGEDAEQTTASKPEVTEGKTGSDNLPQQRLKSWTCQETQCWCRRTWIVIVGLLEAESGQVWELKLPGGLSNRGPPPRYDISFQKLEQMLTINTAEKSPRAPYSRGRGKRIILKYTWVLFFLRRPPHRRS